MTNAQAIILGVVQGLTEYLPVSSSAHLVLIPNLLGWHLAPKESFIFDVLIQLGTLLGVLAYFFLPIKEVISSVLLGLKKRQPLHDDNARLGWMVVLASIPAGAIGLMFKQRFSQMFSSPLASCYFLILTGILLITAEYFGRALKDHPSRFDALFIGAAQSLALFPGVSRSGATIAAGMACGLSRENAARFSFMMSIPIMLGASMVAIVDLIDDHQTLAHMTTPLILGFLSAAISGYLVIKWFMDFLATKKLTMFAAYCIAIGATGAWFFNRLGL